MKSLSTLGLITGIFLMLLALGIWSASRHPQRTAQTPDATTPAQATLADAGPGPDSAP